jgi:outer membrane protein assembly factor BamD
MRKRSVRDEGSRTETANPSRSPEGQTAVRINGRRLLFLVLAAALAGCGGSSRESSRTVQYSVSAQQNYERGMKLLEDKDWLAAAKYFNFVKSRFPYSKYAVLADLRAADALFGAESWLEAIDAYKMFMKLYPKHEHVEDGYAAFRIGEAFYKMLPDDWFLVPPSYEKDLTAARDAARELAIGLKRYTDSKHRPRAQELYQRVAKLLAAHEWYAAEFYWKRSAPMGTVLRLRTLLKQYPGVGYDEKALHLLGRAYLRVGRKEDAKKSFETLVERYPKHALSGDARQKLAALATPAGG